MPKMNNFAPKWKQQSHFIVNLPRRDVSICKNQSENTFYTRNNRKDCKIHLVKCKTFRESTTRGHCLFTHPPTLGAAQPLFCLSEVWCGMCVMYLITASEVGSVDERIHTLADRRMVISLMNGAFDQDLKGLPSRFSCACINAAFSSFMIYSSYTGKWISMSQNAGENSKK